MHSLGQLQAREFLLHALPRPVALRSLLEDDFHHREAENRPRADDFGPRHVAHGDLDGDRHLPFNLLGCVAGISRGDKHGLGRDVRIGVDRQLLEGIDAKARGNGHYDQHQPAVANRPINKHGDHVGRPSRLPGDFRTC